MATVRKFELKHLDKPSAHGEVAATVSFVEVDGERLIQIDTYGSKERRIPGKVSQSIRLTRDALDRLIELAGKHF